MIETEFRSDVLPTAERFACWYEMASSAHVPTVIRSDHEADFRATVRVLDLGAVQVSTLTYPSLHSHRTPKLIRQSDPGVYQLWLTLRGSIGITQSGREAEPGVQDLVLYDTSRPFDGRTAADQGTIAGIVVQFPRALLPIREDMLAGLTAVRLPGREGIGALLSSHLIQLTRHAGQMRTADAARLATVTMDLIAALCTHHLEAGAVLPPEAHQQALQMRIHDFIQQRLGEPGLSPETVAAAHQISIRYLYKLFEDQGLAVAAWIRSRRLERCRRDLGDARLNSHPIHAIAARWGFTSSAHFSRAFRAAYGTSPKDYRHLVLYGENCEDGQEQCKSGQ
ncbi:helix-turn-helix domain-containing protein [Streptomyces sp. NPDC005820]|uniref:AraC-like ligand-binding domain-containing protein n=1 Tax=Streptomyces sp. NPDC005820 TaxID=3157069 RepID=UPI0033EA6600